MNQSQRNSTQPTPARKGGFFVDTVSERSYTATMSHLPKLIAVVGPTASGKSSLAIRCAQETNGEIVSVDSRQVYRGLDIGSGKVTVEEQSIVPHHLLDVAEPNDMYTVSHFQRDAYAAIDDVIARNRLPYLVGGTALYAYAVIDNYLLSDTPPNKQLRTQLASLTRRELQAHVPEDILNADDYQNPRRLIRAIEKIRNKEPLVQQKGAPRYESLLLGIRLPREALYEKIDQRVDERVAEGMIEEVASLRENGASDDWLLKLGLEYRFITEFLRGDWTSQDEMLERLKGAIHAFSKRQMTWFKKDERIQWVTSTDEALDHAQKFLS